jgi:hypothetical protein
LRFAENYFTLQSMTAAYRAAYWMVALLGAVFLGWAHVHTDELPIVLGFVLITGAVLGAMAPQRFLLSWLIAGAPVPIMETLVHYRLLTAPWPISEALPLNALVAFVPALIGVAIGAGVRQGLKSAAIS